MKTNEELVAESFDLSVFENKSILITGATGLIGSLCVSSLLKFGKNINVFAVVRNEEKATKMFENAIKENQKGNKLTFIVQDVNEPFDIVENIDYIIHGASPTASKDFVEKPVEVIETALQGTRNILNFSREKNVKGIIFLSSMEIYGDNEKVKIAENDYGSMDISNVRNSYPEAKKMAELLCVSYAKEFNVQAKIARLVQVLSNKYEEKDNRIVASFYRALKQNEDIVLHTKGETERDYVYVSDVVSALFTILTKGESGEAYNVANNKMYISVYDFAKLCEKNSNAKVVLQIEEKSYYPATFKRTLITNKLENLGWSAKIGFQDWIDIVKVNK